MCCHATHNPSSACPKPYCHSGSVAMRRIWRKPFTPFLSASWLWKVGCQRWNFAWLQGWRKATLNRKFVLRTLEGWFKVAELCWKPTRLRPELKSSIRMRSPTVLPNWEQISLRQRNGDWHPELRWHPHPGSVGVKIGKSDSCHCQLPISI